MKSNAVKFLSRMLGLLAALVLAFNTLHAQSVTVTAITTGATTQYLCGEPFTFLISYSWSGYSSAGPDKIEILDILPSQFTPLSAVSNNGTATITGNQVDFIITTGLAQSSGAATVAVNASFNCDSVCNGQTACNTTTIRDFTNGNWNAWVSPQARACVTDSSAIRWKIKKSKLWCVSESDGDSIYYRISIVNNQSNGYNADGCYSLMNPVLTDVLPTNAVLGSVMPGSVWTGPAPGATGTITFTPPLTKLSTATPQYNLYFWVWYPKPQFSVGQDVLNKATLSYTVPCKGGTAVMSSSDSTSLCALDDTGSLQKSFLMNLGAPNSSSWLPSIAPGCCGVYLLRYKNTSTSAQSNIVITDNLPSAVILGSIKTIVPFVPSGILVQVDFIDISGNVIPGSPNYGSGTHISTPPPGTVKIRWTYSGTAIPVGTTITNTISICFSASMLPGDIVTNNATVSTGNFSYSTSKVLIADQIVPKIITKKAFIGKCSGSPCSANPNGPFIPGDIITMRIAVANVGSADAMPCTITDLLPPGVSVSGPIRYAWYASPQTYPYVTANKPSCCTPVANAGTVSPYIGNILTSPASGATGLLTWTFDKLTKDCDGNISYLVIDFDVLVSTSMLGGKYSNMFTFSATNLPVSVTSNKVWYIINTNAHMFGWKKVGTSPSGPFSSSTTIPAGGTGYYELHMENDGTMPLANLCALDILPHTGDTHILYPYTGLGYNSNMTIQTNAAVYPSTSSTILAANLTMAYSANTNPLRSTVCGGFCSNVDPPGASAIPGWNALYPGPSSAVTVSSSVNLLPGQTLDIIVPFSMPAGVTGDGQACNAFAYQATGVVQTGFPSPCLSAEAGAACITTPPSTGGGPCVCDSVGLMPVWTPPSFAQAWKTITVYNRGATPITWIDIKYLDCSTGNPVTPAQQAGLMGGSLQMHRGTDMGTMPFTPLFNRAPDPTPNFMPFGSGTGDLAYQNSINFNLGLSYGKPPKEWCIQLVIHHKDGDSCVSILPPWNPAPSRPGWGVNQHPADSFIYVVTMGVEGSKFPGHPLGWLTVKLDSPATVLGGTGGVDPSVWDSSNALKHPQVMDFSQDLRTGYFDLFDDTTSQQRINLFIAGSAGSKPTARWELSDIEGNVLSNGDLTVSTIVSTVDPPVANPGTGQVFINSVVPNPGSGSMTFTYSLGTSEDARLELFNTLGQSVSVLFDGYQTSGMHQNSFNAVALAEGTYYLRLTTRSATATAVVKIIH